MADMALPPKRNDCYAEAVALYRLFRVPERVRVAAALIRRGGDSVSTATVAVEAGVSEAVARECLNFLGKVRIATDRGDTGHGLNVAYDSSEYGRDVPTALHRAYESLVESGIEAPFEALFSPDSRLRICSVFIAKKYASLTAGELAELCDLHRSTVYRQIDPLVDAGIVSQTEAVARMEGDFFATPPSNADCYTASSDTDAVVALAEANHGLHIDARALSGVDGWLPAEGSVEK